VLGASEVNYLDSLDPAACARILDQVATRELACSSLRREHAPKPLASVAEATQTPLFLTPLPSVELMWMLRPYLARLLAESITEHGVFLDVLGMGVLITGDSGVGQKRARAGTHQPRQRAHRR